MDFFLQISWLGYEVPLMVWDGVLLLVYLIGHIVFFSVRIRRFFRVKKALVERVMESEKALESEPPAPEEDEEEQKIALKADEKQRILQCIQNAKMKMGRGEYVEARTLIIEGLSIDREHKDLNLLLGALYEVEKDYRKAELVYKDLLPLYDSDAEIYLKLGFVLSLQGKYEIAYEVYSGLLSLSEGHIEATEMLANICHKLGKIDESIEHARAFLRKYPLNAEMLYLLAVNYINVERRRDALETLEKLRSLDPYNTAILQFIEKTKIELEMEAHFRDPS